MVVVMQPGASEKQIQHVIDRLVEKGFDVHRSTGTTHTVLGAVAVRADVDPRDIELLEGVREVLRITQPYKLANRASRPEGADGAQSLYYKQFAQLMAELRIIVPAVGRCLAE